MKLLADECCDALLVDGLRGDGHDVVYVKEVGPGTAADAVLQMAVDQERLPLTEDKDFGELVVRLKLPAYGIVLLRINPATAPPSWLDFAISWSTTRNACPVHLSSSAKRDPVFGRYRLFALCPA